ncbi:hypothetical protein ACFLY5_01150 [Patescibacteria group bacterium]
MTKRTIKILSLSLVLVGVMIAVPAFAVKPNGPSAVNGLAQDSHLYLYEKDPSTWEVVEGGAWGKMRYNPESFVFNGHGLMPKTGYTLLRYNDEWPVVQCLASGESNKGGNLHLSGEMLNGGPKVWLVLSSDVDCDNSAMIAWTPANYLFEYDLI